MKSGIVLAAIFAVFLVGVDSDVQQWTAEEENCVKELKLNKTAIQLFNKQDVTPENDDGFNSFLSCYWKKRETQKADGEINWDKVDNFRLDEFEKEFKEYPDITTLLAGEVLDDAVRKCHGKDNHGDTHGQGIVKLRNCIMEKMKETIENFENIKISSYKLFEKLFKF